MYYIMIMIFPSFIITNPDILIKKSFMHAQIHDNNSFPRVYLHHLNFLCFYVLKLLYTSSVEAMYSGQNTYFHTLCRRIGLLLMCILLGNYVIYIMLIAICFLFRRIHVPLMRRSALEALSSVHVSKLSYSSGMRLFEHGELNPFNNSNIDTFINRIINCHIYCFDNLDFLKNLRVFILIVSMYAVCYMFFLTLLPRYYAHYARVSLSKYLSYIICCTLCCYFPDLLDKNL